MICIDAISRRLVSICPVGTTVVASQVTEAPSTIVLRVRSVSISTSATIKRSKGGTPVILVLNVSIPKEVMNVFVHFRRTIALWRNVG